MNNKIDQVLPSCSLVDPCADLGSFENGEYYNSAAELEHFYGNITDLDDEPIERLLNGVKAINNWNNVHQTTTIPVSNSSILDTNLDQTANYHYLDIGCRTGTYSENVVDGMNSMTNTLTSESNLDNVNNINYVNCVDLNSAFNVNKSARSELTVNSRGITLEGRRIVDIAHFIDSLKLIGEHSSYFGCTLKNMNVIQETRNGLASTIKLKCDVCNTIKSIDTIYDPNSANDSAVAGAMLVGSGYSHLKEITSALNIPVFAQTTYDKIHDRISIAWEDTAFEEMAAAAKEEKELAIEAGDVTSDGTPLITVVCDGVWAKRSYRSNFSSLSGAAAIVGHKTRKVLYLSVRNKFCIVCERAKNLQKDAKKHQCYKNWSGSSCAMESDIICEGFKDSIDMYGLIFDRMVADGDSSCYKKILDCNPYKKYNVTVKKVECRNHLLRNYSNKIRDLSKDTNSGPLILRKEIKKNQIRFRWAVTEAIKYRKSENVSSTEKIENLKKDILNSPSHIFGEHKNCSAYFCKSKYVPSNTVFSDLKLTSLHDKLMTAVRYLANHSNSLIFDFDNNSVEQFNSSLAKHTGGKRINYCQRRSFSARCFAAVVSYNSKYSLQRLSRNLGSELGYHSKVYEINKNNRIEKRRLNPQRNRKCRNLNYVASKNYGPNCEKPDLDRDQFDSAKQDFLRSLELTQEERNIVEQETRLQSKCGLWFSERKKRLTASKFGEICKKLLHTSRKNLVRQIVYPKPIFSEALNYGRNNEPEALADLQKVIGKVIRPCGLIIDQEFPYLAASPDGLIDDDGLVEIKCPYSARQLTPEEGISERKITVWKSDLSININHNWYYQIQGQLHISKRDYCIMCIWTNKGVKFEKILRSDLFWEKKMEGALNNFYMDSLLPELIDARVPRGMDIRDPPYVEEAMKKRAKK